MDGDNFDSRIEHDLFTRLARLLDEMTILQAGAGMYDGMLGELFRYPQLVVEHHDRGLSYPMRDPWKLAVVAVASIYARLSAIAAPHRRNSAEEYGDEAEFWALQEQLDKEENRWRTELGLPSVDSQNA